MRLSPSGRPSRHCRCSRARSIHPCCRADEGATSDAAPSGEDGGVGWAAPPSSPSLLSSTWKTTLVEVPTLLIPTRNRSAAPRLWPAATSRMPTRAEVQFVVILRGSDLGKNRVLPLASALATGMYSVSSSLSSSEVSPRLGGRIWRQVHHPPDVRPTTSLSKSKTPLLSEVRFNFCSAQLPS